MLNSLFVLRYKAGAIILCFKSCVLSLNSNAAKGNLRIIIRVWLFASDLGYLMFSQVHENLTVKHTVLIQVE